MGNPAASRSCTAQGCPRHGASARVVGQSHGAGGRLQPGRAGRRPGVGVGHVRRCGPTARSIPTSASRPGAASRSSAPPSPRPASSFADVVRTRHVRRRRRRLPRRRRRSTARCSADVRPACDRASWSPALLDPRWKVEIEVEAVRVRSRRGEAMAAAARRRPRCAAALRPAGDDVERSERSVCGQLVDGDRRRRRGRGRRADAAGGVAPDVVAGGRRRPHVDGRRRCRCARPTPSDGGARVTTPDGACTAARRHRPARRAGRGRQPRLPGGAAPGWRRGRGRRARRGRRSTDDPAVAGHRRGARRGRRRAPTCSCCQFGANDALWSVADDTGAAAPGRGRRHRRHPRRGRRRALRAGRDAVGRADRHLRPRRPLHRRGRGDRRAASAPPCRPGAVVDWTAVSADHHLPDGTDGDWFLDGDEIHPNDEGRDALVDLVGRRGRHVLSSPAPRAGALAGLVAAVALPLLVAVVALADDGWHATGDMAQAELHVRGLLRPPAAARRRRSARHDHRAGLAPRAGGVGRPAARRTALLGQSGWALEASVALVAGGHGRRRHRRRPPPGRLAAGAARDARPRRARAVERARGVQRAVEPVAGDPAVRRLRAARVGRRVRRPRRAAVGGRRRELRRCSATSATACSSAGSASWPWRWAVRRRWWRPLGIAAAVGVVLWLPPVVEQLTRRRRLAGQPQHPLRPLLVARRGPGRRRAPR